MTTPLEYQVTEPLDIPPGAYNTDDIATLVVTGGSYGGAWVLAALPLGTETRIGEIETAEARRQPDRALKAAEDWIRVECTRLGVHLALFENKNAAYGPGEAPFFATGLAFVDRRSQPGGTAETRS